MGDEPKTTQDTGKVGDEPKGTASEGKKETQTQKTARTYTQAEVDTITANVGRTIRAELQTVTVERDTLKGQLGEVGTEIETAKQSIEDLNTQIEELSKDDPDKIELVKLRREAKAKLATLTARETTLSDREAKAQKFERDQLVFEIAATYITASGEDADPDSLRAAADRFKINDRAGLEALAEEKGWKLKTESGTPDVNAPDSGKTSGGAMDLNSLSDDDLFRIAYSKKKKR